MIMIGLYQMAKDVSSKSGAAAAEVKPYQRFVQHLANRAELSATDFDSSSITKTVVDGMLEADSLEAAIALQDAGILDGRDMVGVPLLINGWQVVKSDGKFEGPLGHYYRFNDNADVEDVEPDAIDLRNGEPAVFATGAPNVMTLLAKAQMTGRLPLHCEITSRDTKNGALLGLKLIASTVIK